MADKPVTVAVATYADRASAEQDYDAIWGIKHQGQIDHLAIVLDVKNADGDLKIDRHDSTAKHLAWGGGVLGGVLTVVSAPFGVVFLGPPAVTGAVWAGVGGLVGHFWKNISKEQVRKMGDLIDEGDAGLVIVAANPKGAKVEVCSPTRSRRSSRTMSAINTARCNKHLKRPRGRTGQLIQHGNGRGGDHS